MRHIFARYKFLRMEATLGETAGTSAYMRGMSEAERFTET